MVKRYFPHPVLTVLLTLTWLLLVNKFTLGNLLLGLFLGLVIPIITQPYWPDRPKLRAPMKVLGYFAIVVHDIVKANIEVAWIILTKRNEDIHSRWICVPLKLRKPEAITVLAGTITLTPGTVTSMLTADGHSLLVHCLHTDDPDGVRDEIKSRYERRLMEIFE